MGARVALVTDGRCSGATRGLCVGYASPEAHTGGPLALARDGDRIRIDARAGTIDLLIAPAELAARQALWRPRERVLSGALETIAQHPAWREVCAAAPVSG